ncbi:hypothetical protein DAPPUDRAFT_246338 [Daphnia pulex]|uniref:Uncharacterized protein n=1 Tax=Daphnia pulex TaxID=6669 RepID=E9GQ84_DAPPU|nr:hypothetical protein DAPPUDRAFT_246338 [Daphnia pulex]|eukprot:EFX78389.1 hypothetical protein DAPPUDRAFT_246338 [Daphnia pulex]
MEGQQVDLLFAHEKDRQSIQPKVSIVGGGGLSNFRVSKASHLICVRSRAVAQILDS